MFQLPTLKNLEKDLRNSILGCRLIRGFTATLSQLYYSTNLVAILDSNSSKGAFTNYLKNMFLAFFDRVKFIYSEKATKFCEIFPLLLTTVHTVKSKRKISQNFVAFSKYMNFKGIKLFKEIP